MPIAPTPESFLATPRPDEVVGVGPVTEVARLQPEPTYSLEEFETLDKYNNPILRFSVVDKLTGERIAIGNERGSAMPEGRSDKYVVWRYHCRYCEADEEFKNGLYAYEVAARRNYFIGEGDAVRIDGDWLLYSRLITYTEPNGARAGLYASYWLEVIAHNIQTSERLELSRSVLVMPGRHPASYYAVNGDMIGWIEKDKGEKDEKFRIRVLDLRTRKTETLDVETTEPFDIAVSRNLVVWRDRFWKGYDLTQDALFTPPWIPPGMEEAQGSYRLSAGDGVIQWT